MTQKNSLDAYSKGLFHPTKVLEALKSLNETGQYFALLPAVEACRKTTKIRSFLDSDATPTENPDNHTVPSWLLNALEDALIQLLKSESLPGFQTPHNSTSEFRRNYIKRLRFDAANIAKQPDPITDKALKGDAAFELAAEILNGTIGGAEPETIRADYYYVRRQLDDPESAHLFFPISKKAAGKIFG